MIDNQITIKNIQGFQSLDVSFDFSEQQLIVVTGKNGIGKTTIVKAFKQIYDQKVFETTSSENAISESSEISIRLNNASAVNFKYNTNINALDTKEALPEKNTVIAELPVPYGERFKRYSSVAAVDNDLRANKASSKYREAKELKAFLASVYGESAITKYHDLCETSIKGVEYYFIPQDDDYYLREDHFSSGEFFLIQIFRLIKIGAKFIIIDEIDIALDAVAQVNLYASLTALLSGTACHLILISHSLALMKQTPDGALYYLENNNAALTLEPRSFGYVNSDLYGFKGLDKYILTEDPVLEGFVSYIIRHFGIEPDYEFKIIGVGGWTQLKTLIIKNEEEELFAASEHVLGILDNDAYPDFRRKYRGKTKVISTSIEDIELYFFQNRNILLPQEELPNYKEAKHPKDASKSYWKWLIEDKNYSRIDLYRLLVSQKEDESKLIADKLRVFLTRNTN